MESFPKPKAYRPRFKRCRCEKAAGAGSPLLIQAEPLVRSGSGLPSDLLIEREAVPESQSFSVRHEFSHRERV